MRYFTFFKIWCVFYIYSTSQFEPTSFQVLNRYTWPVAAILDSADLEYT